MENGNIDEQKIVVEEHHESENGKKTVIRNIQWDKFVNYATAVSIAMIAFYTLGAIKHWKEIKKMK
jgi:hypothetical protein